MTSGPVDLFLVAFHMVVKVLVLHMFVIPETGGFFDMCSPIYYTDWSCFLVYMATPLLQIQ